MPADAERECDPPETRAPLWPLAVLAFVLALIVTEQWTLRHIAEPDAYPAVVWHLLVPLAIAGGALLLPPRPRWLVLGASGCLVTLIFAGDRAYHQFFGTVTSFFMLGSAGQLVDVAASVGELLSPRSLLPLLLFVPFFLAAFWPQRLEGRGAWHGRAAALLRSPRRFGAALLVLDALLFGVAWGVPVYEETHHLNRSPWVWPAEHWGSRYSRLTHASTFGLLSYHVSDLWSFAGDRLGRSELEPQMEERILRMARHKRELNASRSPLFGLARGRHVILIQLESLQHFLLDLEVRGHEVTPTLNALQERALTWDYVMDVTHLGRTSDAEFAVMTGLLPDLREPAAMNHLSQHLITLPKTLGHLGYQTASIHGFKRSFWNRAYTHPAFGIEEMYFEESFEEMPEIGLGPSDEDVFAFAADLLEARRERLQMQFIISLTSHHPYVYVPEEWVRPYDHLRVDAHGLQPAYLASASYTDAAIAQYLSDLGARGLLEESMIVVYGDHDRGYLGADRPIPELGPEMFSPGADRVPLLILVPGEEDTIARWRNRYDGVMGGLHDLFPTVLHLLGEEPPLGLLGTHLFVENERRDPIPLPGSPWHFGHRGILSVARNRTLRSRGASANATPLPDPDRVQAERRVSEALLDHYDEALALLRTEAANGARLSRAEPGVGSIGSPSE